MGSSVTLANGQLWNVASCLLYRPSIRDNMRSPERVSATSIDEDDDDPMYYDVPGSTNLPGNFLFAN